MITAIIQARMSSTRLPGKSLMDICGKPMLQRVIERTQKAKLIDRVVLSIHETQQNGNLAMFATKHDISYYLGSEDDVLDRYFQTALIYAKGDIIVRITGDCPLIDPGIIDRGIGVFLDGEYDYVDNANNPDGMDTEIFTYDALKMAWKYSTTDYEHEHVTPYIINHPEIFRLGKILTEDYSGYHWSVNTLADLELTRKAYRELGENFSLIELLGWYNELQ